MSGFDGGSIAADANDEAARGVRLRSMGRLVDDQSPPPPYFDSEILAEFSISIRNVYRPLDAEHFGCARDVC